MENRTVKEGNKPEFIQGPASGRDKAKVTVMAVQNNKTKKLEIIETNHADVKQLPFMIEQGRDTGKEVVIKCIGKSKEQKENREISKRDEEMTH